MIYSKLIRRVLFNFDAEKVHNFTINSLSLISQSRVFRSLISSLTNFSDPILETEIAGLKFKNPIGLAAGMDKQALGMASWSLFNFGFAEIGSTVYEPQPGNPKPRLWRIPEDEGIIVKLGLPSIGADMFRKNFEKFKKYAPQNFPFGISIAKNTAVNKDGAIENYLQSFKKLADIAGYITINISCPNVATDCDLQDAQFISELLKAVMKENQKFQKPVFLKIGCENTTENLEKIVASVIENGLIGMIVTNSSKGLRPPLRDKNQIHEGGLSGKPLKQKSNEVLRDVYKLSRGKLILIGLGGVFSGADAYEKIRLGANLVQLASGFVYNGPFAIKKICAELAKLLKKDGYSNIKEAVGAAC